jgi:hypothetical protein
MMGRNNELAHKRNIDTRSDVVVQLRLRLPRILIAHLLGYFLLESASIGCVTKLKINTIIYNKSSAKQIQ